jgi:hypothetical protein
VVVDAQYRTLVSPSAPRCRNYASRHALLLHGNFKEAEMGRGLLLWLLGVPIPVIILLWLFFGH